jgi:hypothetical protein
VNPSLDINREAPATASGETLDAAPETVFSIIAASRQRHLGLARNYVGALAKAQHDPRIRALLAEGFHHSRPNVASVLGLGGDQAGLVLALFHGLLLQVLLDPDLAIDGSRMKRAQTRLLRVLPERRD